MREAVDDDEDKGAFESMYAEGPKAIFGAYASGGIVSAAIVNVRTGDLESELITAPLEEGALLNIDAVGSALRVLTKELKWQGSVAIALPGVWHADEKMGGSNVYDAMESLNPFEARREREETEEILRSAVGLDVTVVTGAEAHGYGHQDLWGDAARRVMIGQTLDSEDPDNAMSGLAGVVDSWSLSTPWHVALFKDGVLRTNSDFREADLAISWIEPEWENAKPPADDCEDEEQWKAWATRLAVHLAKVENCRCARGGLERWVVSGSCARNFEKWSHLVPQLSVVQSGKEAAPLVRGGSNSLEGVQRCRRRVVRSASDIWLIFAVCAPPSAEKSGVRRSLFRRFSSESFSLNLVVISTTTRLTWTRSCAWSPPWASDFPRMKFASSCATLMSAVTHR